MRFISDHHVDHALEILALARDTIALYIQSQEAVPPRSLNLISIMEHPLMRREFAQQLEDLRFVAALQTVSIEGAASSLRERALHGPGLLPNG